LVLLSEASLISAALALGSNPVAVKYAVGDIEPLPFVALRFTLAGLAVLAVLRFLEPESVSLGRKDLLPMAGLGIVGVGLNNVLFTFGVDLTSASNTALIYATPPLWGMVLGFVLGTEQPRVRGILGVLLAMLGVGVIVYGGLGGGSLTGDLLVAGAAVCWGSYTAFSTLLLRRYPPLVVAAYTMFVAGLAVIPLAALDFVRTDWITVGLDVWAALAYSTLFVAAFGFAAWQGGISRIGANRVLVYQYLIVLTGVASGVVFFDENLGANKLLGGAIILVGVYLARRQ
jgi:drug/metabolite transporter (DMT)-like permease